MSDKMEFHPEITLQESESAYGSHYLYLRVDKPIHTHLRMDEIQKATHLEGDSASEYLAYLAAERVQRFLRKHFERVLHQYMEEQA